MIYALNTIAEYQDGVLRISDGLVVWMIVLLFVVGRS